METVKKFKLADLDREIKERGCSEKGTWLALRFEKDESGNFRLAETVFHPAEPTCFSVKHCPVEQKFWGKALKSFTIYLLLAARLPPRAQENDEGLIVETAPVGSPTTWVHACHSNVSNALGAAWRAGEPPPWPHWRAHLFCLEKKETGAPNALVHDGVTFLCKPRRTTPGPHSAKSLELRLPVTEHSISPRAILVYSSVEKTEPQLQQATEEILALAQNIEAQEETWQKRLIKGADSSHTAKRSPLVRGTTERRPNPNLIAPPVLDKSPNVAQHSYAETQRFASPTVLESLNRRRNFTAFAIDDGVTLYHSPDFQPLQLAQLVAIVQPHPSIPKVLEKPNERELLNAIKIVENAPIKTYLQNKAKGGAQDKFQTKVGLATLYPPVPKIGEPLKLHIFPLSYWITKEFNRAILDHSSQVLLEFKENSLDQILSAKDTLIIPCPSQFFVEVSLVTTDEKLVLLEKNPKLSVLARTGSRWTCTIEEGLVWAKDIKGSRIDFRAAIERGVHSELSIKPEEIFSVDFFAVALEHTHLNTALIGVMKLSIPSEALIPRILRSEDFGLNFRFVELQAAFHELFDNPQHVLQWHPTARLRALLSLYQRYGRNQVLKG